MSTDISDDVVVEGTTVFRVHPNLDTDELLRRLVTGLGSYQGKPFVPRGERSARFISGLGSATRVVLNHPLFSEENEYGNSWVSISLDVEEKKKLGYAFIAVKLGDGGQQLDSEWSMALEIMPRLLVEVAPTMSFINARLVDVESSDFPSEQPTTTLGLPSMFTPWTQFEDKELDSRTRAKLTRLPAYRSSRLAHGWVVQAVEKIQDEPSPEFFKALETLAEKPIKYRGPMLKPE